MGWDISKWPQLPPFSLCSVLSLLLLFLLSAWFLWAFETLVIEYLQGHLSLFSCHIFPSYKPLVLFNFLRNPTEHTHVQRFFSLILQVTRGCFDAQISSSDRCWDFSPSPCHLQSSGFPAFFPCHVAYPTVFSYGKHSHFQHCPHRPAVRIRQTAVVCMSGTFAHVESNTLGL